MTATVSRPLTIELMTSCCPGRKSESPKVPRMSRFSGPTRFATTCIEQPPCRLEPKAGSRKREAGSRELVVLRERFAAVGDETPDRDEEQIGNSEGERAPAEEEEGRQIRPAQPADGEESQ